MSFDPGVDLVTKGVSVKKICLALLLLVPVSGAATNISVGGVSIAIPDPDGFSPVTPEMALLYELQKQFVWPTNEQFVAFIPEHDVAAALKDDIPDLPRRFTVQTAKGLIGASVSTSDFEKLKNIVKNENAEVMKKLEAELPGVTKQMNEEIATKFDVDLALSVSQMVPLPVHQDTDRTLAYSALVKYEMQDESGNPEHFVAVVTATFVHLKSKVVFLYSYAEESGLEWSKETSRQWANAIVAANPSNLSASVKEALPSAVSGIEWREVGEKGVVGAIVGLIIGLIGWAMNRGKKG